MAARVNQYLQDGVFNAWYRYRTEKKASKKHCKTIFGVGMSKKEQRKQQKKCKKAVKAWFKARKPNALAEDALSAENEAAVSDETQIRININAYIDTNVQDYLKDNHFTRWLQWRKQKKAAKKECKRLYNWGSKKRSQCKKAVKDKFYLLRPY